MDKEKFNGNRRQFACLYLFIRLKGRAVGEREECEAKKDKEKERKEQISE